MLNIMHGKCWQRFQDEKNPYSYSEVDRLLRISERRCKLMGLDAKVDEVASEEITCTIIMNTAITTTAPRCRR